MTVLDAAFWVICLVLAAAGATKLIEPGPLAAALVQLRSPASPAGAPAPTTAVPLAVARGVGGVELALALLGLAVGGRWVAAGVALAYAVFGVVVLVARRRGLPSCGCFGSHSGAPSPVHAVVNLLSAAVAVAAAVVGVPAVADGIAGTVAGGVPVLIGVLAAAAVVIVVDTRSVGATVAPQTSSGGTHD